MNQHIKAIASFSQVSQKKMRLYSRRWLHLYGNLNTFLTLYKHAQIFYLEYSWIVFSELISFLGKLIWRNGNIQRLRLRPAGIRQCHFINRVTIPLLLWRILVFLYENYHSKRGKNIRSSPFLGDEQTLSFVKDMASEIPQQFDREKICKSHAV